MSEMSTVRAMHSECSHRLWEIRESLRKTPIWRKIISPITYLKAKALLAQCEQELSMYDDMLKKLEETDAGENGKN